MSKRITISIVLLVILVACGSVFYLASLCMSPQRLNSAVENRIREDFGGTVFIGGTSLDILEGPLLILSDIRAENERGDYFRAQHVKAKISPWYLLLGRIKITRLDLSSPDVSIGVDAIEGMGRGSEIEIPFLEVRDGSARVLYGAFDFDFRAVNGVIDEEVIKMEARALGGRATIEANHRPGGWKGGLAIEGLDLSQVNSETGGSVRIESFFDVGEDFAAASVGVKAHDVSLPWTEEALKEITMTVDARGTMDDLALEIIEIKTPLLNLSGSGSISGLDGMKTIPKALLEIDIESEEFDYERVAHVLPQEYFPEWLSLLLTRQIREGRSRFSAIRYRGSVSDVGRGEDFIQNFYAALDLMGQSFGACHSPERIEDVTGSVIAEKGNIILKDLSGRVGGSRLESVNITFEDVIKPEGNVLVDVKLDMDAQDFLYAWRAAMVPEDVHSLLLPVSDIGEGRIRGEVRTYSDSESTEPVKTEGEIFFDDCTFRWDQESFRHISGQVKKEDFDSPMKLELSGGINDFSFTKLDLEMEDPFADLPYRFSAHLKDVADGKSFYFDEDADILVRGTGKGPQIEGKLKIMSTGFILMGTHYRPLAGGIEGEGKIEGRVFSGSNVDIRGLGLKMEPGDLSMDYALNEKGGSLKIKGAIDLDLMEADVHGDYCLLRGKISGNADMSWSDGTVSSLSGFIDCEDAKLCYRDSFLDINGPVKLGKRRLSSDRLIVGYDGLHMDVSGEFIMGDPLHFIGDLVVDGVKIDKEDRGVVKKFEGLSVDANLTLTNMKYHGIPIDDARARLTLGGGILRLDKMAIYALGGVAEGKASVGDKDGTDFDINVLFENADLERFLDTISPGKAKIEGIMNLKGRLWGNTNSINGDLAFRATEGTIAKYYFISKMFTVLNVYKIVKKKKVDLLSEGFSYDRIKSSFEIRNGVMKFDNFHFASDSIQMSVVGKYLLRKREVDVIAGVQPLETLGRIVSSVPLLGWVMTGEDKQLLVVMLKIHGNIEDPVVVPQPVKTLSNSVRGIVLRSMQLPTELIMNPENVIK